MNLDSKRAPIQRSPGARAANVDIAQLAARAAAHIDNILLGRATTGPEPVRQLAQLLAERVTVEPTAGPAHLIDPDTVALVENAVQEARAGDQIETVDELVSEARRMIDSLGEAPTVQSSETERLEQARAFCVALSRAASSLAEPVDEGEEHPYRM